MEHVEKYAHEGKMLAIVIRKAYDKPGLAFFTEDDYGLQVGIHHQVKGYKVKPHIHVPFENISHLEVQEMFYIIDGKLLIGLYVDAKRVNEVEVRTGDTVILIGGHSVDFLEPTKLIEVKQGPYRGQSEKRYYE